MGLGRLSWSMQLRAHSGHIQGGPAVRTPCWPAGSRRSSWGRGGRGRPSARWIPPLASSDVGCAASPHQPWCKSALRMQCGINKQWWFILNYDEQTFIVVSRIELSWVGQAENFPPNILVQIRGTTSLLIQVNCIPNRSLLEQLINKFWIYLIQFNLKAEHFPQTFSYRFAALPPCWYQLHLINLVDIY